MDSIESQVQKLFSDGVALLRNGNAAGALVRFQAAVALVPSIPQLHLHVGASLHDLERYEDAVVSYRKALELAPDMGEAHNNLGNSLMAQGCFDEAAECFSKAAEILVESPVPLTARATALQALGKISEAEDDCRMALKRAPCFAEGHWNLALNLLLQGKYCEGWQEYEWRWRKPDFTSPNRHTELPLWDGSPLGGGTILLHAEQGFGDAIQFVRYAPFVAQCGGAVVIECHPQLVSLFQSVEGVRVVVPFGGALPPISCQAPLLSLPRIFGTSLKTIPSHCPYISVPEGYRKKWAEIMFGYSAGLRVGLAWAGKQFPDPLRSCRLSELALLGREGITFFSLQLGDGAEQIYNVPAYMNVVDLTHHITDFADTAALMEQLDVIISVDTSVVHLAGSLGKPTYVMLPYAPDWRWLRERSDSPWYPSMNLFRQQKVGDWGQVIGEMRSALKGVQIKKSSEALSKDFV